MNYKQSKAIINPKSSGPGHKVRPKSSLPRVRETDKNNFTAEMVHWDVPT